MFTKKEIDYMKSIGLNFDFTRLSDNQLSLLEDTIADRLALEGFDENYNPTDEGVICEQIIDKITK